MTRAEVAASAGFSKNAIRGLEKKGDLKPMNGSHGARLFDPVAVQAFIGPDKKLVRLKRARRFVPSSANAEAELGARIFDLIGEGLNGIEITQRVRAHPNVVESFVRQHARMARCIVFDAAQIRRLTQLLGIVEPARDPSEFIDQVSNAKWAEMRKRRCGECRKQPSSLCADCVAKREATVKASVARSSHTSASAAASPSRTRPEQDLSPGILGTILSILGEIHDNAMKARASPIPPEAQIALGCAIDKLHDLIKALEARKASSLRGTT